jgi:hypothetical protein
MLAKPAPSCPETSCLACRKQVLYAPCDSRECEYFNPGVSNNCLHFFSKEDDSRRGFSYRQIAELLGIETCAAEDLVASGLESMRAEVISLAAAETC